METRAEQGIGNVPGYPPESRGRDGERTGKREKDDEEEADTRWDGEECPLIVKDRTVFPASPIGKSPLKQIKK